MDPETERHLAALIMEEAKRMHLRAEIEGVHAYLEKPKVRERPNSRFLTATVRSVQQANRMVEVNEMWRLRQKEKELENRLHQHSRCSYCKRSSCHCSKHEGTEGEKSTSDQDYTYKEKVHTDGARSDCLEVLEPKSEVDNCIEEAGLKDEELQEFLQSRTKRGRGAVGSRMDETGPYPLCQDEEALEWPPKERLQKSSNVPSTSSFDSDTFDSTSERERHKFAVDGGMVDDKKKRSKRKHGSDKKSCSKKHRKHHHRSDETKQSKRRHKKRRIREEESD